MGDSKFRSSGHRTAKGPFRSDELTRKREEGSARNEYWAALPIDEKVKSLMSRRGESKRQLEKLQGATS